jgi:hypothetical protein
MYSTLLLAALTLHVLVEKLGIGIQSASAFAGSADVVESLLDGLERLSSYMADDAAGDASRLVVLPKKLMGGECGCGGGTSGPVGFSVPVMTAVGTSKLEARRRAVEATRRANEARAARDKANIDDATNFLYEVGKVAEAEVWKKERLAQLREQVDAEGAKRVAKHRAKAGAAVAHMQGRGETLTTIAARTDVGIGIVRTMLRHALKAEKAMPSNCSHQLGSDETRGEPAGVAHPGASDPNAATADSGDKGPAGERRRG